MKPIEPIESELATTLSLLLTPNFNKIVHFKSKEFILFIWLHITFWTTLKLKLTIRRRNGPRSLMG